MSSRYTVKIYDKHDNLLGILPCAVTPEYRRRANQATAFSFGVLFNDERLEALQAARFCTLLRNGVEKAAGYVVDRDFSENPCQIECITNEALLRRNITPATWKGWNHMDLADVARDLLLDFVVRVKNTADDWTAAIETYRVDLATEPGEVHLAKDANGQYYPYGYIVVQFDFGAIDRYQLLRWQEVTGEGSGGFTHSEHQVPGQTIKMQFAVSNNGITWSDWSTELHSVFPAEDGVALAGNERYIRIKANLYTDDTTAPGPEGNPVGLTPRLQGIEVIARKTGIVTAGSIVESTGVILEGYTFDRETALRVLQSLCEEHGYEFQVDGRKRLHFARELGRDKTHIVLQRSQNINIQTLRDNAMNLENVILCFGAGEGPAQIQTVLRDEDSIAFFGDEFPGIYTDNQADTIEKLVAGGQRYLQEHAWPKQEFIVQVAPAEFDEEEFGCYDKVTVVDPLRGTRAELRILDEEVREDTDGEAVTLGLNTILDNIIEKLVKPGPIPSEGAGEPAAPTGLILITGPEFIELRWSGKADYFVIEHSTDGENFAILESRWTGNRFRHDGLALGSRHWYRIFGVVGGKQTAVVGPVSAQAWDDYYPDQVAWAECSYIYKPILRWHPVANAVAYEVRTDTNFGANDDKLVFRGDALSYVLENPVLRNYTFYIKALNRSGKYSHDYSSINLTRPVPSKSPQPVVTEFFSALWINILPVPDQGIMGYNLYTTPCDENGNPTGETTVVPYPGAQRVTFYAHPKQSYLIEVAAFDVIGEGPKSTPMQATTRQIDDIALFAASLRPPRVVDELPELPDEDYPEGATVFLTVDSKLYKNEDGEWSDELDPNEFAKVMCGAILAGAIGADQIAAQAVTTEKLAAGSIEAYVAAVQEAFIDSAKIISLEADKIKIGGSNAPIPLAIQPTDTLFRFDNSLLSTQGLKPLGYDGAERTDYGLVTGSGLCATLLPEGGVSVAEGTENLVNNPTEWMVGASPSHQVVEDAGRYLGCKISKTTKITSSTPASQLCAISIADGETYTASIFNKCLHNTGEDFAGRLVFYNYATSQFLAQVETREVNKWERLKITYTNNTGATLNDVRVYYYPARASGSITLTAAPQVEKKPYDTPFTDGTRPAGILPYHDLAKQFNQHEFTFAAWWRPYTEKGIGSSIHDRFFQVDNGEITAGNRIWLTRVYNSAGLRLEVPNADGSGSQQYTFTPSPYAVNTWHFVAVVVDVANMTARIHLNDEYEEFTLLEAPAMLDLQRFFLGCAGTNGQLNGELKNVLIRPYAVSPETIATWHSLDAPFYDPREHIDAESTPIHMHNSEIKGHGHTIRDQYGNKVVFSGVDPDTGDRGYKVYGPSTNEEVAFSGVRGESGERGFFMRDPATGITWLSPSSIQGDRIAELPWDSLSDLVRVLATVTVEGNFILPNMDGSYGFDFIQESGGLHQYIFKSTADTYTEASYPALNWGNATAMRVNNEAYYPARTKFSYVKFGGLSSIPDTEEALDMELRLYYIDAASDLYHVVAIYGYNWSESTLRWDNCPVAQGEPDYLSNIATFNPKKGWVSIRDPRMVSEFNNPYSRDKIINTGFRIYALPHHSNHDFYPQMYTREKGSNYAPTLIVYTRDTQTLPTLDLYVPGGIVFLNRRIFEVSGKILTFPANRSDITIYVYENSSRVAEIDFAHGERAFKADSCVILGAAKTSSNAITEISKARNTGRKEGPRGMGNDVYYFDPIDIDTTAKNLTIPHELGGSRHQVEVEINPTGTSDWFRFSTAAYVDGSNKRGISVRIDSTNLYLDAGSTSVFGYINTAGNPVYVNSAKVRGRIVRLD